MVVGVCRLELLLPGNGSLKGKRAVVRRLIDRTAQRFNVAISEVDHLDAHEQAVIGLAVVSNEQGHVSSMLERIVRFVEDMGEARIAGHEVEIVHVGEPMAETGLDWDDFAEDEDEEAG